jgi:four helix bundle protein
MVAIRFEELECWQKAKPLAVTLYQISKDGEFGRDFGLRDQIRRAAVSIASNIAEGKERETISEFIRYLYVAKGSAGEVMTQVIIAEEVGYLDREKSLEIRQSVQQLSAMIGALIKTLKSGRLREREEREWRERRIGRDWREERGLSSLAFRAFLARPAFPAHPAFLMRVSPLSPVTLFSQ